MVLTIADLVAEYIADQDSTFQRLSYKVRVNNGRYLSRIASERGAILISDIKRRTLMHWYRQWSKEGKLPTGQAFVGQLRSIFRYGSLYLENVDCHRLSLILDGLKLEVSKARTVRMTSAQAEDIRNTARDVFGLDSIALAQAFQFELLLRQKDVIGEWIPEAEARNAEKIILNGRAWTAGLRWEEIDADLILRHATSARERRIEVDLKRAPMVLEELALLANVQVTALERTHLPASGPIILCELNAWPWFGFGFRRKWRRIADHAGVPRNIKNMDSRAGAKVVRIAGRDIRVFERHRPGQRYA
jgi:hypothetical protein